MVNFNFIEFLKSEESNYLDSLQNKLGINPRELSNISRFAGNLSIGNIKYNGILYKISRFSYKNGEINGAFIVPIQSTSDSFKNKLKLKDKNVSQTEVFLDLSKLNAILSQGFSSTAQPSLDGGMGGLF